MSFHPFQGRPSFGLRQMTKTGGICFLKFPSLSGKTFIRTSPRNRRHHRRQTRVSIPFREDLHSDAQKKYKKQKQSQASFHPFQGRPSFGRNRILNTAGRPSYGFHPFQGRPSFGPYKSHPFSPEDDEVSFHPFQGRPSFGRVAMNVERETRTLQFPSLSGKTFIRTCFISMLRLYLRLLVSIPFREDLYSDNILMTGYWRL